MAAWQPLVAFHDVTVPKLHNLRRAQQAGLRVPETWWVRASDIGLQDIDALPVPPLVNTLIVRSGSPTEDTLATSNAGQLLSIKVAGDISFADAVWRVAAALPRDANGKAQGVVFVQQYMQGQQAGVAFFDGFYYESTTAADGNQALTAGQARGHVRRGQIERGKAWSDWLKRVYAVFGNDNGPGSAVDVEFTQHGGDYCLLQARPALFPVRRNRTISLANHKEILGDPPGPWIASVVIAAGQEAITRFYGTVEPSVRVWQEPYAVLLGERAWLNFSCFYRLMDRWGLPRSFVTEGVGGASDNPLDAKLMPARVIRALPALLRLQWASFAALRDVKAGFIRLDAQIAGANDLPSLMNANVAAMQLALRTNFALAGLLSGVGRMRRILHIPGAARLVTQQMMQSYNALSALPDATQQTDALNAWLQTYGHRGPLESDPLHPRFAELRDTLLASLQTSSQEAQMPGAGLSPPPHTHPAARLFRPFFLLDERREWFRDELMRRWQTLRYKMLAEGERLAEQDQLDSVSDVFFLRCEDVCPGQEETAAVGGTMDLRTQARANRARWEAAKRFALPLTAPQDDIEAALAPSLTAVASDTQTEQTVFRGIGLGTKSIEGHALVADNLIEVLERASSVQGALRPDTILIMPALEPSWAIVFGRVGGVVSEIGGELSHASILLREARRPAVINCGGICAHVRTGMRLRLDERTGTVTILDAQAEHAPALSPTFLKPTS